MTSLDNLGGDAVALIETELVLATKEDWERFVRRDVSTKPELPPRAEYDALPQPRRAELNRRRAAHHAAGMMVMTERIEHLHDDLLLLVTMNKGEITARRGMIVSGPPSMGKTTAVAYFAKSYQKAREQREPHLVSNPAFMPVVYCSVPEVSRSKTVAESVANYVGWRYRSRDSASEITDGVVASMRNCGTGLVIIDEIHFLRQTRNASEVDNFLKRLANSVPATFIYLGIDVTNLGDQTDGRFKVIHYDAYDRDDSDEWATVVEQLEEGLVLYDHRPGTLSGPLADYLHARTGGRLGSLSALIREAAIRAVPRPDRRHAEVERLDLSVLERVTIDANAERHWANHPEKNAVRQEAARLQESFLGGLTPRPKRQASPKPKKPKDGAAE